MLKILEFIFSNFWIWLGTFLIIALIFDGICDVINCITKNKTKDTDIE